MTEEVTTYHLCMSSPDRLSAPPLPQDARILRQPPNAQINHALFMEVGTPFRWFSRLSWSVSDWEAYVADPGVGTWLGLLDGAPFGYFELQRRSLPEESNAGTADPAGNPSGPTRRHETEIMFFGVLPVYYGRGLGAMLLGAAVREAWKGADQVYVHTCTSDHPAALGNYLSRGFEIRREQTRIETIPANDDPVWSSPAYYRSIRARAQGQAPTVTSRR